MRNWCKNHPILFMGYYLVFYLIFFALLENAIKVPHLTLHCALDDMIPFFKYAIIPYYMWFAWIAGTLIYMLLAAPRQEFWRLCLPLFAGMTLALLFCAMVPNGVNLRPRYVPGTDIFAQAVRGLYKADTNTNVFPSIHVFNSVTLALAYWRSSVFAGARRRWVRIAAYALCIAILLSTVLLKQHSVIDVAGGVLLAWALDAAAERIFQPQMQYQGKRRLRSTL